MVIQGRKHFHNSVFSQFIVNALNYNLKVRGRSSSKVTYELIFSLTSISDCLFYSAAAPREAALVAPLPRQTLLGLALAQHGSAPGLDGIPYEVLAEGSHFVAGIMATLPL